MEIEPEKYTADRIDSEKFLDLQSDPEYLTIEGIVKKCLLSNSKRLVNCVELDVGGKKAFIGSTPGLLGGTELFLPREAAYKGALLVFLYKGPKTLYKGSRGNPALGKHRGDVPKAETPFYMTRYTLNKTTGKAYKIPVDF